jgi:hypothetical protein
MALVIRLSRASILVISLSLGIAANFTPIAAVGMLAAALVFPQGVHSDHAYAYLVLAVVINFCLAAGLSYWILKALFYRSAKPTTVSEPTAVPDPPKRGIIYTQSEIEEFKRHGLM